METSIFSSAVHAAAEVTDNRIVLRIATKKYREAEQGMTYQQVRLLAMGKGIKWIGLKRVTIDEVATPDWMGHTKPEQVVDREKLKEIKQQVKELKYQKVVVRMPDGRDIEIDPINFGQSTEVVEAAQQATETEEKKTEGRGRKQALKAEKVKPPYRSVAEIANDETLSLAEKIEHIWLSHPTFHPMEYKRALNLSQRNGHVYQVLKKIRQKWAE